MARNDFFQRRLYDCSCSAHFGQYELTPTRIPSVRHYQLFFTAATRLPKLTRKFRPHLRRTVRPDVHWRLSRTTVRLAMPKLLARQSGEHVPATTATRYAVGSISKQFTVAAILLAQEAGQTLT